MENNENDRKQQQPQHVPSTDGDVEATTETAGDVRWPWDRPVPAPTRIGGEGRSQVFLGYDRDRRTVLTVGGVSRTLTADDAWALHRAIIAAAGWPYGSLTLVRDRSVRLADGTRVRIRTRGGQDRDGSALVRVGIALHDDAARTFLDGVAAQWLAFKLVVQVLVEHGPGYGPAAAVSFVAGSLRRSVVDRCPESLDDVRWWLA